MLKQAYVNGEAISRDAVRFEMERLVKFYKAHGMTDEEVKGNLDKLLERAQEQAIGAKLLLERAEKLDLAVPEEAIDAQVAQIERQMGGRDAYLRALAAQKITEADFRRELIKGCRVDELVKQACRGVPEPTEKDVADYFAANAESFAGKTIADVHDMIRDLLRHAARGSATEALVADLREKAKIEYRDVGGDVR